MIELKNKLYTENISVRAAKNIKYLPDHAVLISINEEFRSPYDLGIDRSKNNVLTLSFSDIQVPVEKNGKRYHPLDTWGALQLINFIDANCDKNFIVHCRAGVSRSAAICMYINLTYGHELKENFWLTSAPNCFILGKLLVEKHRQGLPDAFR